MCSATMGMITTKSVIIDMIQSAFKICSWSVAFHMMCYNEIKHEDLIDEAAND